MKNRFTVNLFIDKNNNVTRRNFSIDLETYNHDKLNEVIANKLNLDDKKWTIETSEEMEYVEKEKVIFWKTKLKKA